MRRFGKFLGRVLIIVAVIVGLSFVLPREGIERVAAPVDFSDPAAFLAAREGVHEDITPGTEARIIWAGEERAPTDTVVLYLHGFSATSEEIRPVPDQVAEALGANLVFARLTGHGRSGEALAAARAGDWVEDTELFLDIARAVGNRVLVIGTSTGGTLAAYTLAEAEHARDVAGIAFVSPNFELVNPAAVLLEQPFARVWVPWVAGAERSFEPQNEGHATYWTTLYPTEATVSLGTLLRETREREFSGVNLPALILFSDADRVISGPAVRAFGAEWGGDVTMVPVAVPPEGGDPSNHVIAGDILSPALTATTVDTITQWAREILQ